MATKKGTSRKTSTKAATRKSVARASKSGVIARRPQPVTLVTGGTGFLGTHLVEQLIEAGTANVRVMAGSVPRRLIEMGVEPIEGSITNPEDVRRALEGVAEIYHLAGRVSHAREDTREMM